MYRGRLERDLSLWVDKGLLGEETAGALLAEYDSRPASFSLGNVLMALAAILLAAALLLLVASNWEAIPRLLRVGVVLGLIWAVHIAAAFLLARGAAAAGGLLIIGALAFGGAISLVGQMYHLSGDELSVMYLWFAVATLSAVLFRSGAVAVVAGFLSWASFAVYLENYDTHWVGWHPWMVPVMAGIIVALVRYTGAERARHLAYLLVIGWLAWFYVIYDEVAVALAFAVCGMAAFVFVSLPLPGRLGYFIRSAGAAPAFYSFLVAAIGFLLLHVVEDNWSLVVLGLVTLAASILAIALQGRDNGAVRYLAYATFAAEMLYLASVTVGSILGTSSLFLFSGLVVAFVAWIVIRLERRFSATKEEKRA